MEESEDDEEEEKSEPVTNASNAPNQIEMVSFLSKSSGSRYGPIRCIKREFPVQRITACAEKPTAYHQNEGRRR